MARFALATSSLSRLRGYLLHRRAIGVRVRVRASALFIFQLFSGAGDGTGFHWSYHRKRYANPFHFVPAEIASFFCILFLTVEAVYHPFFYRAGTIRCRSDRNKRSSGTYEWCTSMRIVRSTKCFFLIESSNPQHNMVSSFLVVFFPRL